MEAVLARHRQEQDAALTPVTTSDRKAEVKHAELVTAWLVQDEGGWLRLRD